MRILFLFPREEAYDSQTVREKPSGGTEKTVIFLGEALQRLGHSAFWATTPKEVNMFLANPEAQFDVVITQVASLLEHFPDSKRVWWTHHFSDQPIIQQNAAFARCFADKVVTLSRCHQNDFNANLRIDSTLIGHGVWLDEVNTTEAKDPHRLIYASTPFRGLSKIPDLFSQIKAQEPRATIAICSSMGTYGKAEEDEQYRGIFNRLSDIPGVELKGSLNQEELYKEYAKASIFFYPNTWKETYCLALDEAKAHGCIPLVTNLGALPERVNPYWAGEPNLMKTIWDHLEEEVFRTSITIHSGAKDWLEIAKQWEKEILG